MKSAYGIIYALLTNFALSLNSTSISHVSQHDGQSPLFIGWAVNPLPLYRKKPRLSQTQRCRSVTVSGSGAGPRHARMPIAVKRHNLVMAVRNTTHTSFPFQFHGPGATLHQSDRPSGT